MFTIFLAGFGLRRKINLSIGFDQAEYDLYVAAGSPADPVDVEVTIDSTIIVSSDTLGVPALTTGTGWVGDSSITIINNGTLAGRGGNGGIPGPAYNGIAGDGEAGSNALELLWDVTIDNTNGNVFGGGGGGGATVTRNWVTDPTNYWASGSGGGGGADAAAKNSLGGSPAVWAPFTNAYYITNPTHKPGAGNPGTDTAGGTSDSFAKYHLFMGYGGTGGALGEAGQTSYDYCSGADVSWLCQGGNGSGGAAGKAANLNSKILTWLGGNNAAQVKGAVS